MTEMVDLDEVTPERYGPGTFGCHEALDRTSILMHQAYDLAEHGAILINDQWKAMALKAAESLSDLYQAIGAVHIEAMPPSGAVRNAIASEVESIKMGEVLLAAGEMTAQERRTCRALLDWVAHRIRSSVGHPASSPMAAEAIQATTPKGSDIGAQGPEIGPTRDAGGWLATQIGEMIPDKAWEDVPDTSDPAAISDRANEERRPEPTLGPEGVA